MGKKKFDADYAVFLRHKDEFDESLRIKCVFCPQESLQTVSNYLFHIAREHMFDQYKATDIKEESVQVAMLLKILEDKAKKDFSNEIKYLKHCIEDLKTTG